MPDNKVNLVYYLGAGASANALPVAKDIPDRMNRLADLISNREYVQGKVRGYNTEEERLTDSGDYVPKLDSPKFVCKIYKDMKWLAKSVSRRSVDMLARRHYLQKQAKDLRRLKKALSVFILLEQAQSSADYRYGDFFSYLLDHDREEEIAMPTDVRVISWNYDQQFERAFAEFLHDSEKRAAGRKLQVIPGTSEPIYDDIFSICKLNGSAGVRIDVDGKTMENPDAYVYDDDQIQALSSATRFYQQIQQIAHERYEPELRFAWESASRRDNVLERIEKFAPVDTVVVIGYSFPLFNRDLDREILDMLKPKRVYVQVAEDYPAVTDRLLGLGIDRARIDVVHDQDQFHIPSTYSPSERMSRSTRERTNP